MFVGFVVGLMLIGFGYVLDDVVNDEEDGSSAAAGSDTAAGAEAVSSELLVDPVEEAPIAQNAAAEIASAPPQAPVIDEDTPVADEPDDWAAVVDDTTDAGEEGDDLIATEEEPLTKVPEAAPELAAASRQANAA